MELPTRMSERFTLAALIGRGTCSSVFRARDELLDRDVAVKIFPVTDDPRVAREVHLLASLDHPALVPVYDLGEVDGRVYVVMALFEGGNLADRLVADGPLPLAQTLLTTAAVADALAHVHRAGVLHRDVIPRNVLFDADGRAHLSDFGVAFVVDAPRITDTGIVVGSAPYLAPEQVRGETVGPAADVYSLGLVTIEALAGRPAYEGTPLEAAQARLERRPALPPGLPAEVGELIEGMTADDPGGRPDAETVCRRMRQVALAREVATDDPRTDLLGGGVLPTDLTAVTSRDTGVRRRAGRGTMVLGGAAMAIMLAGGVVIAAADPVDSVAATTPPGAGLAAPTVTAPAPVAPFAAGLAGGGGEQPAATDRSDGSGSSGSRDDEPAGATVLADAPRTASTTSGEVEEAGVDSVLPAPPAPPAEPAGSGPDSGPAPEADSTGTTTPPASTSPSPTSTAPTTSPHEERDRSDEERDRSDEKRGGEPEGSPTPPSSTSTPPTSTSPPPDGGSADGDERPGDAGGRNESGQDESSRDGGAGSGSADTRGPGLLGAVGGSASDILGG